MARRAVKRADTRVRVSALNDLVAMRLRVGGHVDTRAFGTRPAVEVAPAWATQVNALFRYRSSKLLVTSIDRVIELTASGHAQWDVWGTVVALGGYRALHEYLEAHREPH